MLYMFTISSSFQEFNSYCRVVRCTERQARKVGYQLGIVEFSFLGCSVELINDINDKPLVKITMNERDYAYIAWNPVIVPNAKSIQEDFNDTIRLALKRKGIK